MVDGVDQDLEDNTSGVVETALGGKEFRGSVEHREPGAPELKPAPEGVPEKFWDPIEGKLLTDNLIKSYSELEKKIGAPKEAAEEGSEEGAEGSQEGSEEGSEEGSDKEPKEGEEGEDKDEDEGSDAVDAPLAEAIGAARDAYAETGELSAEAREPLHKAGITDEQIDFYIAGVKATEAALHSAAATAAGSEEDLRAAMVWAATEASGWTDKQRIAFNAQMGDVDTIKLAVPGLMAAFRAANPGEGRLTNKTTGHSTGDVYGEMDEFQQDLAKADKLHDKVARRKAIDKLRRSRAAGTVKSERRSPFGR